MEIKRLLIVEDDKILRQELERDLRRNGYETEAIEVFEQTEDRIRKGGIDLVLLDVTLPGKSGYEICQSIRRFSQVPVIFLTSRDSDMDELYGMTLGGDDFVKKPCNMPILLARISALLRRAGAVKETEHQLTRDGLTLYPAKGKLTKGEKELVLTRHEMLLLAYLFSHPGEIVSRVDLIEELWDNQVYIDDNTLSVHMNRLRGKLKELGADGLIKTRYGQGYQL